MAETTRLEHYTRMADGDVDFYKDRVEASLKGLEHIIADVRRNTENNYVDETRNLVAKAADVADYLGKLRSALDRQTVLGDIADAEKL
jgi:hypothetical protein